MGAVVWTIESLGVDWEERKEYVNNMSHSCPIEWGEAIMGVGWLACGDETTSDVLLVVAMIES